MSVLDEIVASKKRELVETIRMCPLDELLEGASLRSPVSFTSALTQQGINIIAEIKYKSPSHGSFKCQLPAPQIAKLYSDNGAVAVSVLTEQSYFAGDLSFLDEIDRELPQLPLLRKDFIVDRYQVAETRRSPASAYLLIVSCLSKGELAGLIDYGRELDLETVVEVHDLYELEIAMEQGAQIIGVNNRDLETFEVSVETSFNIARRMEGEENYLLISESGIETSSQVLELRDAGFNAFLVGSSLMDSDSPGQRLKELRGQV
ncbi:MAG: indole-3-glycerol phosphate synthase TrpC [Acidobacteriota bacterium]|nr:indole-3-glycerol phosphate synthase TrpC [Acidobacteriota bacterium]